MAELSVPPNLAARHGVLAHAQLRRSCRYAGRYSAQRALLGGSAEGVACAAPPDVGFGENLFKIRDRIGVQSG